VINLLKAAAVELIRRLWDRGLLSKFNRWANAIHDNWLHHWVDWKTGKTMKDVDRQVEEIRKQWDDELIEELFYSEIKEGDTPLGGPMQLSHPTLGKMDELTDDE